MGVGWVESSVLSLDDQFLNKDSNGYVFLSIVSNFIGLDINTYYWGKKKYSFQLFYYVFVFYLSHVTIFD